MKKIFALLLIIVSFGLTACTEDKDEPKTMQDVNIEDAVELKMELIFHYEGPFIDDTYYEVAYYDLEEEWSYYEIMNYYDNGDSFIYYYETIGGNTYLYDYEDVDYDAMDVPSRFIIDYMSSEDDFTFMGAFEAQFDGVDPVMVDGLEYYSIETYAGDLNEMLSSYIQSLSYEDVMSKMVKIEMWCHPTSEYCDYRFNLDEIAEDTVTGDFDDLDLTIDIVHTFYTENQKVKSSVFPDDYIDDDHPNTLDSLMFSGNRTYGPLFEGRIDFEYDGDVFMFQVQEAGLYRFVLSTENTGEQQLYIYIIDESYNFQFEGIVNSSIEAEHFALEEGANFYIVIASADGTIYDFEYHIICELVE